MLFFGVIAYFFVKRFVDETRGKTLEELSRDIMGKVE